MGYKGGRTLADLKKFATNELGPGCSVDTMENCTDEQKAALQTYIDMPAEERASTLETLKTELKDAESKHETLLKELQATYKASMDGLEKLKEESAPKIAAALSHDRWRRAFAWPSARCRVRVSVEVRIRYDPWPHQLPYWGRGSG